jgi:hypothetical protein
MFPEAKAEHDEVVDGVHDDAGHTTLVLWGIIVAGAALRLIAL